MGLLLSYSDKICPLQSQKYFMSPLSSMQLPITCSPPPVFGMDSILPCTFHQGSLIMGTAIKSVSIFIISLAWNILYHNTAAEPCNLTKFYSALFNTLSQLVLSTSALVTEKGLGGLAQLFILYHKHHCCRLVSAGKSGAVEPGMCLACPSGGAVTINPADLVPLPPTRLPFLFSLDQNHGPVVWGDSCEVQMKSELWEASAILGFCSWW